MDNNIYQDEFEEFLQDEIQDHRMYPSDHIWRNIQSEVHGNQTWPALTFISIFIISALTVSTLLNNHPLQKVANLPIVRNLDPKKKGHTDQQKHQPEFNSIATDDLTANTIANVQQEMDSKIAGMKVAETPVIPISSYRSNQALLAEVPPTNEKMALDPPVLTRSSLLTIGAGIDLHALEADQTETLTAPADAEPAPAAATNQEPSVQQKIETANADLFLHEYAAPTIKNFVPTNSKFGFGFFVTPSTSYRVLSDSRVKEILGAAPATAPVGVNYTADVNNIVRHKPAIGLELGFAVLYNMTNRLKFKTGVQFNIRQYYIETFQSSTDLTTLSLVNNRGVENISVFSPYNNNNGYKSTQLDNKMYQVSIPIGIQYDLIHGHHFGVTAEASVQPTLNLNKSLYLLSSDYKHYADGNSLMRKWNINSAVSLNASYHAGAYQWYMGPQLRYQHLPTYSNQYPITEHLLDYGLRIGFIKQIK